MERVSLLRLQHCVIGRPTHQEKSTPFSLTGSQEAEVTLNSKHLLVFWGIGPHCVALAGLKLTVQARLDSSAGTGHI